LVYVLDETGSLPVPVVWYVTGSQLASTYPKVWADFGPAVDARLCRCIHHYVSWVLACSAHVIVTAFTAAQVFREDRCETLLQSETAHLR